MAYARFIDSDIYIYPSTQGGICCSGCLLDKNSIMIYDDYILKNHLLAHIVKGHKIPEGLLEEILSDPERY